MIASSVLLSRQTEVRGQQIRVRVTRVRARVARVRTRVNLTMALPHTPHTHTAGLPSQG